MSLDKISESFSRIRKTQSESLALWQPDETLLQEGKQGRPTIIVPGFNETFSMYDSLAEKIAGIGRSVKALTHTRGIRPDRTSLIDRFPKALSRVTAAIRQAVSPMGMSEVHDGVGYSMGGPPLIDLALQLPSSFNQIVLVASAGLVLHSPGTLVKAAHEESKQWKDLVEQMRTGGEDQKKTPHPYVEVFHNVRRNPFLWIQQLLGIARADIRDALKKLQEVHGITVDIVTAADDLIFRIADDIEEICRTTGVPERNIHVLEGGSHLPHIHLQSVFNEKILEILQANP